MKIPEESIGRKNRKDEYFLSLSGYNNILVTSWNGAKSMAEYDVTSHYLKINGRKGHFNGRGAILWEGNEVWKKSSEGL